MAISIFALLDEASSITNPIYAALDDVAIIAAKGSKKAINSYVVDGLTNPVNQGAAITSDREIPIIKKLATKSFINKIFILTPAVLVLSYLLPFLVHPLLIIAGVFLCYEAAMKAKEAISKTECHLVGKTEDEIVKHTLAIDLILGGEILLITMSMILDSPLIAQAITMILVSIITTVFVYGLVLFIIRMDEMGEYLQKTKMRKLGDLMIASIKPFLGLLAFSGMIFMASVGSYLIIKSLYAVGVKSPYKFTEQLTSEMLGMLPHFASDQIIKIILGFIIGAIVLTAKLSMKKTIKKFA